MDDDSWWQGPEFLRGSPDIWPERLIVVPQVLPGVLKQKSAMTFHAADDASSCRLSPDTYSSWRRLVCVTAWCLRFLRARKQSESMGGAPVEASESCCSVKLPETTGKVISVPELSAGELKQAEHLWIAIAQRDVYSSTFKKLKASESLDASDKLNRLQPVLDSNTMPALMSVWKTQQVSTSCF